MRTFPAGAAPIIAITVIALVDAGCGPKRGSQFVRESDPAVKIPAIKLATKEQQTKALPQLVKDLASEDPAVRFYAIEALERLTSQTFDFVYYAPEEQRRESILKWRAWLENQGVDINN